MYTGPQPSPEPPSDHRSTATVNSAASPLTTDGPLVNHRSTVVDRQSMVGQRWPRGMTRGTTWQHVAADVA
ncbi:hypothetical protein Tco_1020788 [Tanacetum coccineum]